MRSAARNRPQFVNSLLAFRLVSGRDVWEPRELDRTNDPCAVDFLDCRKTIQHKQLRPLNVIWSKRGVGGSARQGNLAASPINNIAIILVPFDDATDVPNVMRQAGDDKVRIVGRCRTLR